jgi:hypothetical protein
MVTVNRVTLLSNTAGPRYMFFELLRSTSVTFSNFLVEGNTGSIIQVKSGAYVTFKGCTFNNNTCKNIGNCRASIARIESYLCLLLANSTFSNNIASLGSILVLNETTKAAISGCSFNNNEAKRYSPNHFRNTVSGVTVTDSRLRGNSGALTCLMSTSPAAAF